MTTTVERFYIGVRTPVDEEEAIRLGLSWLEDRVEVDHAVEAVLATYSRWQILSGTILTQAVGEDCAARLHRGKTVFIGRAQLALLTERKTKWPRFARPTPVLCVYTRMKQLDELDRATNVSALCLVVTPDMNQEWVDKWRPRLISLAAC
jgi:hypothetical protein